MANIESRRIKRKILRVAAVVGAALLLCGIVLAIVLLPRACGSCGRPSRGSAEASASAAADTPAPSNTAAASESPASPTEPSSATTGPSPEPSQTAAAAFQTPEPSGHPRQTSEDRSIALYSLTVKTYYDNQGLARRRIDGGCTIAFVNNTDSPMYSADLKLNGFEVLNASVSGAAVRFYVDESGVCVLPFGEALEPGDSVELFIKLYGSFSASDTAVLPYFDYDTVYDAVCFAFSDSSIVFSPEGAKVNTGEQYEYTLEAGGVRQIKLSFGEA